MHAEFASLPDASRSISQTLLQSELQAYINIEMLFKLSEIYTNQMQVLWKIWTKLSTANEERMGSCFLVLTGCLHSESRDVQVLS